MPTAVPTDRERTAVQAYLRLLHTVRAAFAHADTAPDGPREAAVVPPAVLAEAEQALDRAGLAGNEVAFFRLLELWCPRP
ncbi:MULTISPECIES: hypothetical protein [unclassified Streptomyces]|uniref:hypothetical protein n=1 Tax=unclassified Streptomyces TaxID=2593676 RepID=UPI001F0333A1|nr:MULTISPECIES: hypothetical protein [unclassified Streptomyces]MCH0563511.1 hypothetical protein [Streptomyces sp. MUM 2J]MCH0570207.1 hypothetical protein [Streptomyces sp. MUM 136J]